MKKQIKSIVMISGILLMMSFDSTNILAQESINKLPAIGLHRFVPGYNVDSPFTNTSFRINIGLGNTTNITYPPVEIGGEELISINGEILFANLGFSYQQKVADWAAIYTRYVLNARIGSDVTSLLVQGVNTVSFFEIGWLFKVWEHEKFVLSLTTDVQKYSGTFINIQRFVDDIINNNPNPNISQSIPVLTTGVGVRFGYALSEVTGIRFIAESSYGERFSSDFNSWQFGISSAVDFNFFSKYNVPIGIVLGYDLSSTTEVVYIDETFAQIGSLDIIYTGMNDFSIGLETSYARIPIAGTENDAGLVSAVLTMIYFFN